MAATHRLLRGNITTAAGRIYCGLGRGVSLLQLNRRYLGLHPLSHTITHNDYSERHNATTKPLCQ